MTEQQTGKDATPRAMGTSPGGTVLEEIQQLKVHVFQFAAMGSKSQERHAMTESS
jgi:hypothetical protein